MSQHLIISGKAYLPSAELALRFGYTSDYVSRLAREKKIVGACINRKWFIHEESFIDFTRLTHFEKINRNSELRVQRKIERLLHSKNIIQSSAVSLPHVHVALAQSLAVFMCGAFVSLLGWTVIGSDIGVYELTLGAQESYTQVAEVIIPDNNPFIVFATWSVAAVSQKSGTHVPAKTDIETVTNMSTSVFTQTQNDMQNTSSIGMGGFSDEVDITFESDSEGIIRPVFKHRNDGQEYRMLVAPTNTGG